MQLIIGAGQAGYWASRTLREAGYDGPIVMIGAERHPPYERPPLSKQVLLCQAPPESAALTTAEALAALRIDWRADVRALSIDPAGRRVLTDAGALDYDQLFIATGARNRKLGIPGEDAGGVHSLRTLDEAAALAAALADGGDVVVVGAGWIGLEVAAAARTLGDSVTVVELGPRVCGRGLPELLALDLQAEHERRGVRFRLGCGVERIEVEAGRAVGVRLAGGEILPAKTVVIGVGAIPNDELASEARLETRDGVIVDGQGRTSDPAIFAAGDVARYYGARTAAWIRCESWSQAQDQAIAAARAMAGVEHPPYDPTPWFWSDQYDLNIQVAGETSPALNVVRRGRTVIFLDDTERVRGAAAINGGAEIRVIKSMIERGAVIDPASLARTDLDLRKIAAMAKAQSTS
ncbi:MAG TPA: FAD-dependent oxidoreductase [Caulobacteraceae bacterium]|nr:FAD-dependent oxidoreductase [Caulobacteraceae bacterium]